MSTLVVTSSEWHTALGATPDGEAFSVHYHHDCYTSDLIGCHSLSVLWLGNVRIAGITFRKTRSGAKGPDESCIYATPKVWKPHLSTDMLRDAVYTHVIKRFSKPGFVIFSDRINRNTLVGGSSAGHQFDGEYFNCSALAKWLSTHPELGTLTASPIVNNPNYTFPHNFALAQVWVFVPKERFAFTEETGLIGPDINIPKESFLKTAIPESNKDYKYPTEEYGKVTYL